VTLLLLLLLCVIPYVVVFCDLCIFLYLLLCDDSTLDGGALDSAALSALTHQCPHSMICIACTHNTALDVTLGAACEKEEFEMCLQDWKTSEYLILSNDETIISRSIPKGPSCIHFFVFFFFFCFVVFLLFFHLLSFAFLLLLLLFIHLLLLLLLLLGSLAHGSCCMCAYIVAVCSAGSACEQ
jgi:hypothetical protein